MAGNKDAFQPYIKQIGVLTTIPILLLAGPAVGYFIGAWIDRNFRIYPWFTILFVLLGFTAAGREIVRLLKVVLKEDKAEHDRNAGAK